MALVGNYSVLSKSPGRFSAGQTLSCDRGAWNKPGISRGQLTSFAAFSSVPNGYNPPASWLIAQKGGGLASYRQLSAAIATTAATLNMGLNAEAALSAGISITNADLGLIANLVAALTASISLTQGELAAVASMEAAITASMVVTDAQLGAIVAMVVALSASGAFTNADDFATASMAADISSQTELSPGSLAAAVWSAIAAEFNVAGSMGEKLNDAGSAANPWTEVIEGSLTATEVLRLLLAVAAGKSTIVDLGGGAATVKFRSVADDKDRITATMADSERAAVVRDGS